MLEFGQGPRGAYRDGYYRDGYYSLKSLAVDEFNAADCLSALAKSAVKLPHSPSLLSSFRIAK